MGITKTSGFSNRIVKMADTLKVLGHPARLSIMEYLANTPNCVGNDLVDEFPLAQPTISRHLSELKRVGLIKGTITGKNICYCIDSAAWSAFKEEIERISQTLFVNKNCVIKKK